MSWRWIASQSTDTSGGWEGCNLDAQEGGHLVSCLVSGLPVAIAVAVAVAFAVVVITVLEVDSVAVHRHVGLPGGFQRVGTSSAGEEN
jgi:hypothetical protein